MQPVRGKVPRERSTTAAPEGPPPGCVEGPEATVQLRTVPRKVLQEQLPRQT